MYVSEKMKTNSSRLSRQSTASIVLHHPAIILGNPQTIQPGSALLLELWLFESHKHLKIRGILLLYFKLKKY